MKRTAAVCLYFVSVFHYESNISGTMAIIGQWQFCLSSVCFLGNLMKIPAKWQIVSILCNVKRLTQSKWYKFSNHMSSLLDNTVFSWFFPILIAAEFIIHMILPITWNILCETVSCFICFYLMYWLASFQNELKINEHIFYTTSY